MAYFALEETSAGFGSYHMEYEYGNASMPYKYIREAIQIANPAPQGDYTKNLLTLDQAGETTVELTPSPSGATEAVAIPLSGSLSAVAAGEMTLPLILDSSLVGPYNEYNYTEYEAIDPASVTFTAPFHFAAGERHSSAETPVQMIITGKGLEAGKEYLAAVRIDCSGVEGVAPNTAREVFYVRVSLKSRQMANTVTISGWTFTANDKDYTTAMSDGQLTGGWAAFTEETPEIKVEIDMTAPRTIIGWRMGYIDNSFKNLCDIEMSLDGQKWVAQASGTVELALTDGTGAICNCAVRRSTATSA